MSQFSIMLQFKNEPKPRKFIRPSYTAKQLFDAIRENYPGVVVLEIHRL